MVGVSSLDTPTAYGAATMIGLVRTRTTKVVVALCASSREFRYIVWKLLDV